MVHASEFPFSKDYPNKLVIPAKAGIYSRDGSWLSPGRRGRNADHGRRFEAWVPDEIFVVRKAKRLVYIRA
jgi:hypothetical protein